VIRRKRLLAATLFAVVAGPGAPAMAAPRGATAQREVADLAQLQNILAASALSADIGASDYQKTIYAPDAVMDVGGGHPDVRGRDAIVSLITDPGHQTLRSAGLAHVAAQPFIRVTGDKAVAVGYLQIISPEHPGAAPTTQGPAGADRLVTWRMTANRWEFERRDGHWQITRRTIRPAPSPEALEIMNVLTR